MLAEYCVTSASNTSVFCNSVHPSGHKDKDKSVARVIDIKLWDLGSGSCFREEKKKAGGIALRIATLLFWVVFFPEWCGMDPFLSVKLLLLSCNLDEEGNQHFVTRSRRKAMVCWFLNGAGWWWWERLSPTLPWASSGQPRSTSFWVQRLLKASPFSLLHTVCLSPTFVCPGHASPLLATPDEAGPGPIISSRMSAKSLTGLWALLSSNPSPQQSLRASCNVHLLLRTSRVLCTSQDEALTPWHRLKAPMTFHLPASSPFCSTLTPKQTSARPVESIRRHPQTLLSLPGKDFFLLGPFTVPDHHHLFFFLTFYFVLRYSQWVSVVIVSVEQQRDTQ